MGTFLGFSHHLDLPDTMVSSSPLLLAIASCLVSATWGATVCTAQGKLEDRMMSNLRNNDRDRNGVVTGNEVFTDFGNYDLNGDGCCSRAEWVYRWITFYKFSAGYSEARLNELLTPNADESCLIKIADYKDNTHIKFPEADFVSVNVQSLIDFCDKDPSLFTTNCDCAQLGHMCNTDQYFKNVAACVKLNA